MLSGDKLIKSEYLIPAYTSLIKAMQDIMIKEEYQTRENYLLLIDYYHGLYFHNPGGLIHSALLAVQREYELKFPVTKEEK